jgi:Fe-S-cluster-containing hydrogenase component 2
MQRLYVDNARCSGCRACLVACSLNQFNQNNPKWAALRLVPHFPEPGTFEVVTCTQCGECAEVCPTEAIRRNERGAWAVVREACNLCEACVAACPDQVMFVGYDQESAWKCDLCGDCVKVCGMEALRLAEVETV